MRKFTSHKIKANSPKMRSRNEEACLNYWKTGPVNPCLFKVKSNTALSQQSTMHKVPSHVQVKMAHDSILHPNTKVGLKQKNLINKKQANEIRKLCRPLADFINAVERNHESSRIMKRASKNNSNKRTSKPLNKKNEGHLSRDSYLNQNEPQIRINQNVEASNCNSSSFRRQHEQSVNQLKYNRAPLAHKIYPRQPSVLNVRKKEHRTRSHDPTSNRYGRASIQVDDTEKISCQLKRRICSVKKNRDRTNVTLENSNALPRVDLRRGYINPQSDKSSNQSFFRHR
jgi:hypothetical protein